MPNPNEAGGLPQPERRAGLSASIFAASIMGITFRNPKSSPPPQHIAGRDGHLRGPHQKSGSFQLCWDILTYKENETWGKSRLDVKSGTSCFQLEKKDELAGIDTCKMIGYNVNNQLGLVKKRTFSRADVPSESALLFLQ